jgi:hypothetical protein
MLRTSLDKAYLKRTIRPLYGWTQATPTAVYLDSAWDRSVNIWPGMAMIKTTGDNVTLAGNVADKAFGLSALYIGGDGIDEVKDQGVNAMAVWTLAIDAQFEILAPAFDASVTWTDGAAAGVPSTLVHFWATGTGRGKLVPAGATLGGHTISTLPVGRLIKVNSASKITIGGLAGTAA